MKKSIAAIMMVIMLVLAAVPVSAAEKQQGQTVYIAGKKVNYSQAPVTMNGSTMVSARETMEAMGLKFTYDKANKRIIGTSANKQMTVSIVLNQWTATINGVSVFLGSPAVEKNGRIIVPLRFLVDSLGASMETKGSQINIKLNSQGSSKYNTGLPLEITNTTVTNRGKDTITVNYFTYFYEDWEIYTYKHSLTLEPGKKGVFELSTQHTGSHFDYQSDTDLIFLGRLIEGISVKDIVTASKGLAYVEEHYLSNAFEDNVIAMFERHIKEFDDNLKQRLKQNKNVPLEIIEWSISYDVLNYPEANIAVRNLTDKTIASFELSFSCYDAFGQKVTYRFGNSNRFKGTAVNSDIKSGYAQLVTWDLTYYARTSQLKNITIDKVAFSDGTVWKKK
ncbi:stalk domain-containing protein [Paenibacillus pinihumi]|uniref:stalk domain-containing protein n=1 Tax=Paenibacillus pinihumi TaxID=669462 RepID=UPI00049162C0|nr:stalk domain-containing protein [Paenibacillus pinihumi]